MYLTITWTAGGTYAICVFESEKEIFQHTTISSPHSYTRNRKQCNRNCKRCLNIRTLRYWHWYRQKSDVVWCGTHTCTVRVFLIYVEVYTHVTVCSFVHLSLVRVILEVIITVTNGQTGRCSWRIRGHTV